MAVIFDIMSSNIVTVGASDFVVDNLVTEVPVTNAPVGGLSFSDANGNQWFELGDNIILTGIYVNIPFGFGQGSGQASLGIVWNDGTTSVIITEFAGNSVITLPNICSPLELPPDGLFVANPRTGLRRKLALTNIVLNVSQINAPAMLNGSTLKVQFHLRINHTLPCVAVQ